MNGAKLVYHMRRHNIGNQELAEKVGVSTGYISGLRTGKKTSPTIELLIQIADALEVTVDELVRE